MLSPTRRTGLAFERAHSLHDNQCPEQAAIVIPTSSCPALDPLRFNS